MGVQFDRMLEPFTGPFEKVTDWNVKPPPVDAPTAPGTLVLDRRQNDASSRVNRLLAAGEPVRSIGRRSRRRRRRARRCRSSPTSASRRRRRRSAARRRLRAPRIGLWDQYGGSMESGWTRWILEQFEFPFARVFAPELDAGNLNAKYDVLIFVDGAIPALRRPAAAAGAAGEAAAPAPDPQDVPAEYRSQLGRVTRRSARSRSCARSSRPAARSIAIGSSATNLAAHFKLPIENHLVENGAPLPRAKYFVPGSVLDARRSTRRIRWPPA